MFSISLDPRSMQELVLFAGLDTILSMEVQHTMATIGDTLVGKAQEKTWEVFTAPTGQLAATLTNVSTPWEVMIGSDSPYSRRREKGFSGMTDSLGRYFANDPAKPYMEPTLIENEQWAFGQIEEAVQRALNRLTGQ